MSSPVQAMPLPLRNLTRILLQSHSNSGRITFVHFLKAVCSDLMFWLGRIPAKALQEITEYLSSRPIVPIHHVEEIIAAIDHEEPTICCRLDLQGFLLVYRILSLTEECLAYHRGLSLLSVRTLTGNFVHEYLNFVHSNHCMKLLVLPQSREIYEQKRKSISVKYLLGS